MSLRSEINTELDRLPSKPKVRVSKQSLLFPNSRLVSLQNLPESSVAKSSPTESSVAKSSPVIEVEDAESSSAVPLQSRNHPSSRHGMTAADRLSIFPEEHHQKILSARNGVLWCHACAKVINQ